MKQEYRLIAAKTLSVTFSMQKRIHAQAVTRTRDHVWSGDSRFASSKAPRHTIVGNVSHLRRRMYHVKQLRRRSGNSTYCQLPAVGRAQADRRQGLDRDRVGKRAGNLTPIRLGIQDGGPGGRRLMTAGTTLLTLVHDDVRDPWRTRVKTTMMSRRVRLIDAPDAQSTGTLRGSVVATRTRSGLGPVDHQRPTSRPPMTMTVAPNRALGTVIATRRRPSDNVARSYRRRDNDPTYGGIQQVTPLLRGPLGGLGLGMFLMTVEPDHFRLRVVGRDVLLFRHRAHFAHAARDLLAVAELVVDDIAMPRQNGFATVTRFVTDAAADAAVVVATLGVHDRMTASVDREREILREGENLY